MPAGLVLARLEPAHAVYVGLVLIGTAYWDWASGGRWPMPISRRGLIVAGVLVILGGLAWAAGAR